MNGQTLRRRLLAALAAAALGLVAALAGAGPAHAASARVGITPDARIALVTCSGVLVLVRSDPAVEWTIAAGGEVVFPLAGDMQPGDGENRYVYVPFGSGDITVSYAGTPEPDETWPRAFTERVPPAPCAGFPELVIHQPTCDTPGQVIIPDLELLSDADPRFGPVPLVFTLDGSEVARGSSQTVAPGTHTLTAGAAPGDAGVPIKVTYQEWVFTIDEPECPGTPTQTEAPTQTPTQTRTQGTEPPGAEGTPTQTPPGTSEAPAEDATPSQTPTGTAGLPVTGPSIGIVAGIAVLLLGAGAGLFLLNRRRRSADDAA